MVDYILCSLRALLQLLQLFPIYQLHHILSTQEMKSNITYLVKKSLMKKFYHFDLRIHILNYKLMFIKNH